MIKYIHEPGNATEWQGNFHDIYAKINEMIDKINELESEVKYESN